MNNHWSTLNTIKVSTKFKPEADIKGIHGHGGSLFSNSVGSRKPLYYLNSGIPCNFLVLVPSSSIRGGGVTLLDIFPHFLEY